jgi:hypothetical protein
MWVVAGLVLALLASHGPIPAAAVTFDTATVDGVLNITSSWDGGFCGSLMCVGSDTGGRSLCISGRMSAL